MSKLFWDTEDDGNPSVAPKGYTAELRKCRIVPHNDGKSVRVQGRIYGDKTGRWPNGTIITTSLVKYMTINFEDEFIKIKTLNSTYYMAGTSA